MTAFRQQFPKSSMVGRCECAIASTSSPLDVDALIFIAHPRTVRHYPSQTGGAEALNARATPLGCLARITSCPKVTSCTAGRRVVPPEPANHTRFIPAGFVGSRPHRASRLCFVLRRR